MCSNQTIWYWSSLARGLQETVVFVAFIITIKSYAPAVEGFLFSLLL